MDTSTTTSVFAQFYWIVFAVFAAPILISFVLRQIAGKHAPDYPVETEEEVAQRIKRKKAGAEYWHLKNLDVID